ncbi:MAG: tRNA (adenosine(37)-N6)-threonylcarbamoyltransferase complex ATPase subunit type 1 TsaE [Candidatus Eisenbacteria sp.]|nr:tRNA (adenosine(37)-N6)-threonylcarbamoyltransferase complex ATPase subunit type 1 TsaE [Candidatus Eisenbacteria bacterium]
MMSSALTVITRSEGETRRLGARVAALLEPGDILALIGELGTGKTRFIEGACRRLGYAGRVRSPSYTLLNIYKGHCPIYHFDLYRWDPAGGEEDLGGWEELMEGDGISMIEWADRLEGKFLRETISIHIAHVGGSHRRFEFHPAPPHREQFEAHLAAVQWKRDGQDDGIEH